MSALQPQQPQQTHSAQQRARDDTAARRQVMAPVATGQMTKGDTSSGHEPRNSASHHVPGVYYEDLLDPLCHRVSQALDGMKSALSGATPPAMAGMYSYEDFMHLYRSTRENILMALDDFLVGISLRHRIPHEHAAAEQGAAAGLYPGSPMSSREVPQLPLEHYLDLKLEAAVGEHVRVGGHLYPEAPVGSQQRSPQDMGLKGALGSGQENSIESQQATDAPLRFGCESCGKRFATSADLVRHCQELHARERPYVCTVCAKSFKKRCHLDRHSILHSGERQHTCEICRSTFYRSDILDRHRRTHVGVKPYRCDICGHGCRDAYSLALHHRTHTRERMSPCTTCGKMFRNSCLMRHTTSCRQNPPTLPED
ncbi:hypothetical protein R5R35_005860 [Gryllus longicercus]